MVSVLSLPGLCIGVIVVSLQDWGNDPSSHDLLYISSNLYNGGFPRLIIISLVMQSGPGDFLNFSLNKALVSSSYEISESITGGICCCCLPTPPVCSCGGVRQPNFSGEALPGVSST